MENNTVTPQNPYNVETNAYPKIRHILIVVCLLFTISVLLFLLYQNGKSIYDNGL